MSTERKPLTLKEARESAEASARLVEGWLKMWPWSENAGQWHADEQMLRRLLEASAAGPTTHDSPTGAGDFDIVCDGCGEAVPSPHSWAECCAAQRKRVESLCGNLAQMEHDRDEVITERDTARKYGDELEDALLAIKEAIDAPYDMTALDAVKVLHKRDQKRGGLIGELLEQVECFKKSVARKLDAKSPGEQQRGEEGLVWAMNRITAVAQRIEWHERHPDAPYVPAAKPTRPDAPDAIESAKVAAAVVGGASEEG